MYKLIYIVILIFISNSLFGQVNKDFQYFNTLTYNQYLAKDWKNLTKTGRKSIQLGYDSHFIRMRLGIALYSSEKYMLAEKQFKKALQFNSDNPTALEYLHYTMIFTGRDKESECFYPLKEEDTVNFFQNIYIESGVKLSDEKAFTRDIRYGLFSLKHGLSKRTSYFHAFQYLVRDYIDPLTSGSGYGNRENILQTKQYEYYGALEILAGKGLYITPAYHYQSVRMEGNRWNNFVFSLGLSQHIGITNIYANISYSKIDFTYQYQGSIGLTIYPLANQNLYIDNMFTAQHESENIHSSIKQKLGGKVLKKTWLEGWYSYGDMRYFNEQNAFIFFNNPSIIHYRYGVGLIQGLGKHLLYLNVIKEYKEEYETRIDFSHIDVIIGLKIKL